MNFSLEKHLKKNFFVLDLFACHPEFISGSNLLDAETSSA